mmetsp:Transcript_26714/g.40199  ORF Transcript_26714/g.40199 Transcript_26714/m.40199 type:complete len:784 (+) Transcript_26714:194-2545(+)
MMMMDNHSHHITQQLHNDDDRRHNSPSSFIDNIESYSPYSSDATMSPLTMMQQPMTCSPHEKAVNDNDHNGGASSSLQWSGGRPSSWDHPPTTYSHQQQQDVPPAARVTNDGQSSSDHQSMNCPPSETIATSKNSGNSSHINSIPEKDRFLYTLFDILSSSSLDNNEESIAWLPHGQGFTIVNKPMFESEILKKILPNVKYASFVKRLKRYKFVRISSGLELGAYYHPYFRRGQPNLLPLINTIDEIPIERYGVNVNDVVTHGASKSNTASCGGGGGCNAPINSSSGSPYIDPPSSNLVDFVPKSAFSPIDGGDGGSIYSASLSLGSITAEDLCVGPTFFEDVVLPFKRDDVEDYDVVAVDDNDEDDGLDLISIGGGVVAPPPLAAIACERKAAEDTSLLNEDILAVQQQLLRQEQVLQYEREKLKHVQLPLQEKQQQSPAIVTPTPTNYMVIPDAATGNRESNNTDGSSGNYVAKDMKSFPEMLRQISKAKRLKAPVTSSFATTATDAATTIFDIPTASMGGGHDTKKRFQYRRRGSAPENLETMRENTRKHQYRRMSSTDAIMAHRAGESKYQYDRKKSADSMLIHRKGSSDSNTCYTMEDKSGKYRYPSSSFTKTFSRLQNQHHRKTNVPIASAPFGEQLGQQHHSDPEEVQPYFDSMDWNGVVGTKERPAATLANNVTDDSLLNLDTDCSLAGHHHRNQQQQQQQQLQVDTSVAPPSVDASAMMDDTDLITPPAMMMTTTTATTASAQHGHGEDVYSQRRDATSVRRSQRQRRRRRDWE